MIKRQCMRWDVSLRKEANPVTCCNLQEARGLTTLSGVSWSEKHKRVWLPLREVSEKSDSERQEGEWCFQGLRDWGQGSVFDGCGYRLVS